MFLNIDSYLLNQYLYAIHYLDTLSINTVFRALLVPCRRRGKKLINPLIQILTTLVSPSCYMCWCVGWYISVFLQEYLEGVKGILCSSGCLTPLGLWFVHAVAPYKCAFHQSLFMFFCLVHQAFKFCLLKFSVSCSTLTRKEALAKLLL